MVHLCQGLKTVREAVVGAAVGARGGEGEDGGLGRVGEAIGGVDLEVTPYELNETFI